MCNIRMHWQKGETAGKSASIPDVKDRDDFYTTLNIFPHATEEAKLIPGEFCKDF